MDGPTRMRYPGAEQTHEGWAKWLTETLHGEVTVLNKETFAKTTSGEWMVELYIPYPLVFIFSFYFILFYFIFCFFYSLTFFVFVYLFFSRFFFSFVFVFGNHKQTNL